jgi:hypothetical protein
MVHLVWENAVQRDEVKPWPLIGRRMALVTDWEFVFPIGNVGDKIQELMWKIILKITRPLTLSKQ